MKDHSNNHQLEWIALLFLTLSAPVILPDNAKAVCAPKVKGNAEFLNARIARFEVRDYNLFEALGKLNDLLPLSIAAEGRVPAEGEKLPERRRFSIQRENATVRELLDALVSADGRYVWRAHGQTINLIPRELAEDPDYIFNRTVGSIPIANAKSFFDAVEAIFAAAEPGFTFAISDLGSSSYAEPWTATLEGCTVRELVNRAATQRGPTQGWQFGGRGNFRMIQTHTRLRGPREKPLRPGIPIEQQ